MKSHIKRLVPFFLLLALLGFLLLIHNITSLEKWNCQTISTFNQIKNSNNTASKAHNDLFSKHKIQKSNNTPSKPNDTSFSVELNLTYCAHLGQKPTAEEVIEEKYLLNSTNWPGPLVPGLTVNLSSDPAHSYFVIRDPALQKVGSQLVVDVHMQNYMGQAKNYGGDFLVARLHSPELGAGVAGQVHDHQDGNYTVLFPLLWAGVVQVEITLVHPSEAVEVLKRLTKEQPDRVYFQSLFRSGHVSETTVCNLCLPDKQQPVCNFTDPQTGEPWYCYKPKRLGCDTRINHAKGGYKKNLITEHEAQFFQSGVNIKVKIKASGTGNVTVLPAEEQTGMRHSAFTPAGYYYNNSWKPLVGTAMRQFTDSSAITQCLRGKRLYMFGDSTVRQWFEYLITCVPNLKEFNLHSPKNVGPYMAVDSRQNILVSYYCHGPPIRFNTVYSADLHYVANELDKIRGGSDTVVAVAIWSHFSTFPMQVYIRRLRHIRKAVLRLLNREPSTLVVIRTANLQKLDPEYSLFNSDWFSFQQYMVLRAMFSEINVQLLDAWEMTLAHHHTHLLHPPISIIKNMMDLIFSHICPVKSRS